MPGRLLHQRASAQGRLRIDQFVRTEGRSAFLALVPVGTLRAASRTGSRDVTVGKESPGLLVEVLLALLLDELPFIVEFAEESRCILRVHL